MCLIWLISGLASISILGHYACVHRCCRFLLRLANICFSWSLTSTFCTANYGEKWYPECLVGWSSQVWRFLCLSCYTLPSLYHLNWFSELDFLANNSDSIMNYSFLSHVILVGLVFHFSLLLLYNSSQIQYWLSYWRY